MSVAAAPRSLGVGSLVGRAWATYRARFGLYLAATAVAQLPTGLIIWLVGYGVSTSIDAMLVTPLPEVHDAAAVATALLALGAESVIPLGLLLIAAAVLQVIGTVMSAGALAYLLEAAARDGSLLAAPREPAAPRAARELAGVAVMRPALREPRHTAGGATQSASLGTAYHVVLARLWPLFGAILLAGFIICAVLLAVFVVWIGLYAVQYMLEPHGEAPPTWVGAALMLALFLLIGGALVYAVWAFVRWALFVQAVVLEGCGPADALRRSAALLQGRWWQTALLLTVLAGAQAILGSMASGLLARLLGGEASGSPARLVSGLGLLAVNLLFFPIAANALTLLYFGLRARERPAAGSPR
ncbi:MAG TPA: hypothetical protein VII06_38540 [Chloroflexota bacterium]|jgi:hypothetical protein